MYVYLILREFSFHHTVKMYYSNYRRPFPPHYTIEEKEKNQLIETKIN